MSKRVICILNCILVVVIFLCVFGNICYRSALAGKGGADFGQRVALCVYFAISLILAIACICYNLEYSNKLLLVTAVYNGLLPVVLLFSLWLSCGMVKWWKINYFK